MEVFRVRIIYFVEKMILRNKLFGLAEKIHEKIFGHKMSGVMHVFLGQLSWSVIGGIGAAAIMFAVQILAARWLGPEDFGRYNALLSFATALSFFFLLGNDVGTVRFISAAKSEKDKKRYLSASLRLIFWQIVLVGSLAWFLYKPLVSRYGLSFDDYILGVFWAATIAFRSILDAALRSFGLFRQQAGLRLLEALVVSSVFVSLIFLNADWLYGLYAVSVISGVWVMIFGTTIVLRHFIDPKGNDSDRALRELFHYNKFVVLGALGGFLLGAEKMVIAHFIGLGELGLYSLYYAASFLFLSNLGGVFVNAFLPAATRERSNLSLITNKIIRLFALFAPLWLLVGTIFGYLAISLAGNGYDLRFGWLILFVSVTYLALIYGLLLDLIRINFVVTAAIISLSLGVLFIFFIWFWRDIVYYLFSQLFIYALFIGFMFSCLRKQSV